MADSISFDQLADVIAAQLKRFGLVRRHCAIFGNRCALLIQPPMMRQGNRVKDFQAATRPNAIVRFVACPFL